MKHSQDNLIVDVKIWNMIHETINTLKSQLANLEVDVKDNAHYRKEAVANLDRAELAEAQLARCIDIVEQAAMEPCHRHCIAENECLSCLAENTLKAFPKTAHLDVEILRCAREYAKREGWLNNDPNIKHCGVEGCFHCPLGEAVKAREES